jgi:hypothetical protein
MSPGDICSIFSYLLVIVMIIIGGIGISSSGEDLLGISYVGGTLVLVTGIIICCTGLPSFLVELFTPNPKTSDESRRFTKVQNELRGKSRIVYHPDYNIHAFGLEKLHPFDSKKYGRIYEELCHEGFIQPENVIFPFPASRWELLLVHTRFVSKAKKKKLVGLFETFVSILTQFR